MPDSANGKLSARGAPFGVPEAKHPMLDIVANMWHPANNPDGYLSLGVAENTLMHEELANRMKSNQSLQFDINSHTLTYGDGFAGSHALRASMSGFINRHFKPVRPVQKEQVTITSGMGPAIESCAFNLCDPNDGMLLARPYYGSFPGDLASRAQVQVVGVPFGEVDPFGLEALESYESAIVQAKQDGIPVRALILCNPHNPLGRCYSREVLIAYLHFCQKHKLHLLSDEIYALSVWKNPEAPNAVGFTSVLSIDLEGIIDPNLVHVLWGMSKDFGSNGIRLACVVTQSNTFFAQALESHSYFTCPSALSDQVTRSLLDDLPFVENFIQTNQVRLADAYSATAKFFDEQGVPHKKDVNAGFFIWVNLFDAPALKKFLGRDAQHRMSEQKLWDVQENLQSALLAHRVFLASGAAFGSDVPGWFRVVFAHERSYLMEGLGRVIKALDAFGQGLGTETSRAQITA